MICPKCGHTLPDNAKFCTVCGASLNRPASAPTPAPVSTPPTYSPAPASKKGLSGGIIALIVAMSVLVLVAVGLLVVILTGPGGTATDTASPSPAPSAEETATPADGGVVSAPIQGGSSFDVAAMSGTYYCAQETGSTLELRMSGDQLSIYKTYYTTTDISTVIPVPNSSNFTINYGGRIIEFYYAASGRSVTVTESGYSSIFTTDGDRDWVIDAAVTNYDPFTDPNGYILPTDSRYISESELYSFSKEEVKLIRNEIYARHGYSFSMEKFRNYFNSKNWYHENTSVNVNTFGTAQMNVYERANVDVIKSYEQKMGW